MLQLNRHWLRLTIPYRCICRLYYGIRCDSELYGIPWNSMELFLSSTLAHSKFRGIPCMELFVSSKLTQSILITMIFNVAGWINFRRLISTLYLLVCLFHPLMFIINNCTAPHEGPTSFITYQNIIHHLFSMLMKTYFDQNLSWNNLDNIWTTYVVPWNCMDFRGASNFPEKCSMEFLGIPGNFFEVPLNSIVFKQFPKYCFGTCLMIICYLAKSHRNAIYCINCNIIIRILNTPAVSKNSTGPVKMAYCSVMS